MTKINPEVKRVLLHMRAIARWSPSPFEMIVDGNLVIGINRDPGQSFVTTFTFKPGKSVVLQRVKTPLFVPSRSEVEGEHTYNVPINLEGLRRAWRITNRRLETEKGNHHHAHCGHR